MYPTSQKLFAWTHPAIKKLDDRTCPTNQRTVILSFFPLTRSMGHSTDCVVSEGDPTPKISYLILATTERPLDPCRPSPCGINAECREHRRAASCTCLPGLQGDPYVECKPECSINPECPQHLACIQNKCKDPCPGVCGVHARCSVQNHSPVCRCDPGYIGDPFSACYTPPTSKMHIAHSE